MENQYLKPAGKASPPQGPNRSHLHTRGIVAIVAIVAMVVLYLAR